MLEFRIDATQPVRRQLDVRLVIHPEQLRAARPRSNPADQHDGGSGDHTPAGSVELSLPTWTPGSYLIREYSRHLSRVVAHEPGSGRALPCDKVSKNRFRIDLEGAERIEVSYRVYAHELSVRTADVNAEHAYWNHACVLLWPVDQAQVEAQVTIDYPSQWTVATSLDQQSSSSPSPNAAHATVVLQVADLDQAIDTPILIGNLERLEWQVAGIPHAIVLDGLCGIEPPETLAYDLARIAQCAVDVFGGVVPYPRYLFLALFAADGHGGLEHRDSSTLLMARTVLTNERSYRDFLGLAAHELFHAWNVKRLRPAELWSFDYEQENYTRMLWLMEGWTAYYDDLLVARAELMTTAEYLSAMTKNINAMLSSPGRWQLSLEESSFDAWIRLYRPDENTRNSSQNYYGNGAVVAMCLDLMIRRITNGDRSLDHVLRTLWQTTFAEGRGYRMQDVEQALSGVVGSDANATEKLITQLRAWVSEPLDPDFEGLLADVGVHVDRPDADRATLGVVFRAGSTVISSVIDGGAASEAGLAPADEVLALQGLRVTGGAWQNVFRAVAKVARPLEILVSRRGVITTLTALPQAGVHTVKLVADDAADEQRLAARRSWLSPAASE